MSATILPWWDSPAAVKPNEFERGVLTGMLLKCGKSDDPTPADWSNVNMNYVGVKIETWVSLDGTEIHDGETWSKYYLHQKKTYNDGTVEQYSSLITRYSDWGMDEFRIKWSWEFDTPNDYGNIVSIIISYSFNSDPTQVYKQGLGLNWRIPTTYPTVVI